MSSVTARHVHVHVDDVGRRQFFLHRSAPESSDRFQALRFAATEVGPRLLGSGGAMLMALIAFELVAAPEGLARAYAGCLRASRWRGAPFVDWEDESGRRIRRLVRPVTAITIVRCRAHASFPEALTELDEWLVQQNLYPRSVSPQARLDEMLADGATWAVVNIPGYLAAHVIGEPTLSSVSRECLAREASGRPLAPAEDDDLWQASDEIVRLLREARPVPGLRRGADLKKAVLGALSWTAGSAPYVVRRKALRQLGSMASELPGLAIEEAVLIGFAIHLLQQGTPRKQKIALVTVAQYWSEVAIPLLDEIPGLMSAEEDVSDVRARYLRVIEAVDPGSRHKAQAALSAFHAYLGTLIDVPVLLGPIAKGLFDEPAPRANLVWPHEIDRIRRSLEATRQTRLIQQIRAVFELLVATGARIGEVLSQTLESIRFDEQPFRFVIDPPQTHRSKKSLAASREIPVTDEITIEVVRRWVARRIEEGADQRDLLFGDPLDPSSKYRPLECSVTLTTILKATTGDHTSCLHDFRHTRLTKELSRCSHDPGGERMADAISAWTGHESTGTTRENYFHAHELALFNVLGAVEEAEPISASAAAAWLNTTPDALRKRASRSGVSVATFARRELALQAAAFEFPDVTSSFEFREGSSTRIEVRERQPGVGDILSILVDATDGRRIPSIALRTDLGASLVARTIKVAARIAEGKNSSPDWQGYLDLYLASLWTRCSFEPDFSRVRHSKLDALRNFLSTASADADLRAACRAWSACRKGSYVSLDKPSVAQPLLSLLWRAGTPVDAVGVATDCDPDGLGDPSATPLNSVRERFESLWACAPRILIRSARRGRPGTYLVVGEDQRAEGASASIAMGGFNALMLSATVLVELMEDVEA